MLKRKRFRIKSLSSPFLETRLLLEIGRQILNEGLWLRFRVSGSSMHPTIRDGDLITVKPVSPADVRVGDIVLCRYGSRALVHRVVAVKGADSAVMEFVLKGDSSSSCDKPVPATDLMGKVVDVKRERSGVRQAPIIRWTLKFRCLLPVGKRGAVED
jgi:signal peptidase I